MSILSVSKPAPGPSSTWDVYDFQVSLCLSLGDQSQCCLGKGRTGKHRPVISRYKCISQLNVQSNGHHNQFPSLIILEIWLILTKQRALTLSAPPRFLLYLSQHRSCSLSRGSWKKHMFMSQQCLFTVQCSKRNSPSWEVWVNAWNGAAEVAQVFGSGSSAAGNDHQQRMEQRFSIIQKWQRETGP